MLRRIAAGTALAWAAFTPGARADANLTDLQANADAARQTAVMDGWQGSVALGYLQTTGNVNSSTLNGKALAGYKSGPWQDSVLFQALKSSQEGALIAESFNFDGQTDYNFNPDNYLFGNLDYLRDVFSGYERRTSEVVGLGHRLLNSDTQQLALEVGVGARQTHFTDGTRDSEPVERFAANYLWKFSGNSNFTENLSILHGASNTLTQSVSTLTANLYNSFALSVSYTVNHNSDVLPGFKNTDTVTALSLVYSFAPPQPPAPVPPPPPPAPDSTVPATAPATPPP